MKLPLNFLSWHTPPHNCKFVCIAISVITGLQSIMCLWKFDFSFANKPMHPHIFSRASYYPLIMVNVCTILLQKPNWNSLKHNSLHLTDTMITWYTTGNMIHHYNCWAFIILVLFTWLFKSIEIGNGSRISDKKCVILEFK